MKNLLVCFLLFGTVLFSPLAQGAETIQEVHSRLKGMCERAQVEFFRSLESKDYNQLRKMVDPSSDLGIQIIENGRAEELRHRWLSIQKNYDLLPFVDAIDNTDRYSARCKAMISVEEKVGGGKTPRLVEVGEMEMIFRFNLTFVYVIALKFHSDEEIRARDPEF